VDVREPLPMLVKNALLKKGRNDARQRASLVVGQDPDAQADLRLRVHKWSSGTWNRFRNKGY
jgi:hypothetical protein